MTHSSSNIIATCVGANLADESPDEGQIENEANAGHPREEGHRGGNEAAEEQQKAVRLDAHADEWPAEEDDEDAQEEGGTRLQLVPLKEEPEGPLDADDEGEATDEEQITHREEALVEEHEHAEEEEGDAEGGQAEADLLCVGYGYHACRSLVRQR